MRVQRRRSGANDQSLADVGDDGERRPPELVRPICPLAAADPDRCTGRRRPARARGCTLNRSRMAPAEGSGPSRGPLVRDERRHQAAAST
jgi:hypothetical protein